MQVQRHEIVHVRLDGVQTRAVLETLLHGRNGRDEVRLNKLPSQYLHIARENTNGNANASELTEEEEKNARSRIFLGKRGGAGIDLRKVWECTCWVEIVGRRCFRTMTYTWFTPPWRIVGVTSCDISPSLKCTWVSKAAGNSISSIFVKSMVPWSV